MYSLKAVRFGLLVRNVKDVNYRTFHLNLSKFIQRANNDRFVKHNNSALNNLRLISTVNTKITDKKGFLGKMLTKIPFININKRQLLASGFLLYETIADKINYFEFFEELNLPDTFYSWFVVTELHIWMISVRSMAEGDDGRALRNYLLQALWGDVAQRIKRLGDSNPSIARQQVVELSEQLQAALIAYDEGIQSDDVVLAGALWRRFYQQGEFEPRCIEKLVKYVRQQMTLLDQLPRNNLMENKGIIWIRFKEHE